MDGPRRLGSDDAKGAACDHDLVAGSVAVPIGEPDLLTIGKAKNDLVQRHGPITPRLSSQPGRKRCTQLRAATRSLEARTHPLPVDHDNRRRRIDAQPSSQIGPLLEVDPPKIEGVVISPTLQDLGEKPLRPARTSRGRRIQEHQNRLGDPIDKLGTSRLPYRDAIGSRRPVAQLAPTHSRVSRPRG